MSRPGRIYTGISGAFRRVGSGIAGVAKRFVISVDTRNRSFLNRRPHRSFQRTRSRDMPKFAPLPGNIYFTTEVMSVLRQNRGSFIWFLLLYTIIFTLIAGIISQSGFASFSESVKEFGPALAGGDFGKAAQTWTLFGSIISMQMGNDLGELQQFYLVLLSLITWMSIVWFLRHRLQGQAVNVRDAIYRGSAPLVPSVIVVLIGMVQLLPGALGILAYTTANQAGYLKGGVEAMMFGLGMILLVLVSLYWVSGTLLALIVVTIPGTYPFRAMSMAGDVVVGRRAGLFVRILWMLFVLLCMWVIGLIPMILLADALPWKWLPIVPFAVQLLTAASIIVAAAYMYLLYRRMIDEPAR